MIKISSVEYDFKSISDNWCILLIGSLFQSSWKKWELICVIWWLIVIKFKGMISSSTCKFCWWLQLEILMRDHWEARWLMNLNNSMSLKYLQPGRVWRAGHFKSYYNILVTLSLSLHDQGLFVTKCAAWCWPFQVFGWLMVMCIPYGGTIFQEWKYYLFVCLLFKVSWANLKISLQKL